MKKTIVLLLLLLSCSSVCSSQGWRHRKVSFELGIGGLQSFNRLFFDRVGPGLSPYCELRYNFRNVPVDIGAGASVQIFRRSIGDAETCDFISKNIMLVSDCMFYYSSRLRCFAGMGVGIGFFDFTKHLIHVDYNIYAEDEIGTFPICVMPRVGIEAWNHLRISLGYMFEDRANSNLNLRIGYVF